MKLTHPSCLRAVIAKHRADVEELLQAAVRIEFVLQIGAHGRRRVLWTQRQTAVTAVGEGIHLLVHDIRAVADPTLKELRVLEHRRADFTVAIAGTEIADHMLDMCPRTDRVRQYILRAARRIRQHQCCSSSYSARRSARRFSI